MLKDERLVQHQPTQHPTSEESSIGKIKFKAFDLGGHQIAYRVWKHYTAKVDAVVYLVDAYDKERFAEYKKELDAFLSDEALAVVPFLILGNKIVPGDEIPDWFEYKSCGSSITIKSTPQLGRIMKIACSVVVGPHRDSGDLNLELDYDNSLVILALF